LPVIEPKIPFLRSNAGTAISFAISLVLWYILMGWTDGIESSYYLDSAAAGDRRCYFGWASRAPPWPRWRLRRVYVVIRFLRPDQYIPEGAWELVLMRAAIFPVVGYSGA